MMGLGKKCLDFEFGNFVGVEFTMFLNYHSDSFKASILFSNSIFSPNGCSKKEYMKLNVGNVVGNMTRGYCILIYSMKS